MVTPQSTMMATEESSERMAFHKLSDNWTLWGSFAA